MLSPYNYGRRPSKEVRIGTTAVGGENPVRLQSMTNTDTLDVEGSAAQAIRIADAGGEIVRLTTQGVAQAEAMGLIRRRLDELGCLIPLVADVHFHPRAAMTAATLCEKVRINPGNFVDAARTFRKLEFTDEEYAEEIERIRVALRPLLELCRQHDTALRLGVNHGSLSDRIMSRYGDTAEGMVESVMEFLRICEEEKFDRIVISVKASNTKLMVDTVRLLVATMEKEGMNFPLHLGVTEAGDGEDGRVKSAVGIGTLLAQGIGDTIRVSLSESPESEIPMAKLLRDHIAIRQGHAPIIEPTEKVSGLSRDFSKRLFSGSDRFPAAYKVDFDRDSETWMHFDASTQPYCLEEETPVVVTSSHINAPGEIRSWIDRFQALGNRNPIVVKLSYPDADRTILAIKAGADFGALLLDGYASAIWLDAPLADESLVSLELAILQAARLRFTKPDYIACPGCGRTLFDLQSTLTEVKEATAHLKGLKIGVMGCVVNGPGEMADADYGYVGAGRGRVSIYRGKQLIHKNILREDALRALIEIIKADGRWIEP